MSQAWDQSKFDAVLLAYLKVTSRTVAVALNTKAMFVARNAALVTFKTPKEKIGTELGRVIRTPHTTRTGRTVMRRSIELTMGRSNEAPLAALILNMRRGKEGKAGLYGKEMAKAIRALLATRLRSIAFIKSGWLTAVRVLVNAGASRTGQPGSDSAVRQYGQPKGDAVPANEAMQQQFATITNNAVGRDVKSNAALEKVGGPGLTAAFEMEAASMEKYLEDKLRADAERTNAQLA